MNSAFLLNVVFPLIFILIALSFTFIALKTLIGRRPLIFSYRWIFAFMCLTFFPSIAYSASMAFSSSHDFSMMTWINPLMFTVFLVIFWIQMKGYVALAISDSYFREALLNSANSLGLTIEETMSCVKIEETGEEMQVAIHGWIGTAQLKPTNNESKETVRKIADGMTKHFQSTPGKMNYTTSYFYLILGIFMAAMSVGMSK